MQTVITKEDPLPVGIACTSYYLPPNELSVEELGQRLGMTIERRRMYREFHGLRAVRVSAGESVGDLAVKAAEKIFTSHAIQPEEIDLLIIYHTMYITSIEPRTLVGEVQRRLGLTRSVAMSISGQYCASVISALRAARAMIAAGIARTALLIGVDHFAGSLKREIDDITLQGEGAAAAIVQRSCSSNRLLALSNVMEGSLFRGIFCSPEDNQRFNLLYFLTAQRVVRHTLKVLGLTLDDIRLIVPHNINYSSWSRLLDQLKCPKEKFYGANIGRHGHICGSDLIINLTDIVAEQQVQKGDYLMMLTVGLGASWACAVIEH